MYLNLYALGASIIMPNHLAQRTQDMPTPLTIRHIAFAAIALFSFGGVHAHDYPSRPVTIVVPFPPGGATDILARLMGAKLGEVLKQPFLVDNKAGATGAIGLNAVAKSPADGYTLVIATASSLGTNPAVSKVPFDPVKDFTPVAMLAAEPMGLAVHPSVPAHNVQELIALAKAKPGSLNMASFGTGSVSHLAGEYFNSLAGIRMVHIPNNGASTPTAELIAGEMSLMFN